MAVQVIKATKPITPVLETPERKLRTCCYCRVSTDSDAQETSYEAQIQHFTDYINAHPNMVLSGCFADEGISGTSLKNRDQFNRMIRECEAGMHDLVLVKSISRLARNTVITLETIRKLKDLGIPIIFEKESINTMDANGEMLITILSSLAQQESESISKNIKLGINYLFQQGKPHLNTNCILGLAKGKDQHDLVIVPEEAVLVRRIFREYLEGYSPGMIAGRLTKEGIKTPAGKDKWYQSTIASILENEKMCGDILMGKWYVQDFLTHKIVKNQGELPLYFVENYHQPIVPKDVFYQVQGEMQRRSLLKYDPGKIRFGSTEVLKGRLYCGLCGRVLKKYRNPNPEKTDWRCRARAYEKRSLTKETEALCKLRNVPEQEVKRAIIMAFNELPLRRDELVRLQGAIWDGKIKKIDEQIDGVKGQQKRVEEKLEETDSEFLKEELERLELEYTRLVVERAEEANREVQIRILLELVDAMWEKAGTRLPYRTAVENNEDDGAACYDYEEFFARTNYVVDRCVIGDDGKINGFPNDLILRYLDKVVVNPEGYEVKFKAGVSVNVSLEKLNGK